MKTKKLILIAISFLVSSMFLFASNFPFIEFSVGLSSGHNFYGEEEINLGKNSFPIKFSDGKQILAGTEACLTFNFTDRFGIYTDIDFSADLNWNEESYSHHVDYSASSGIKFSIFSAIPGLNATVGYLLGSKTDFIKMSKSTEILRRQNPWGNGFKFGIEYNFSRTISSRFLPTIGCCWRHIPRGNFTSDNSLNAYAQINIL